MTGELYIYKRYGHFQVSKNLNEKNRTFGYYKTIEEAIFARNLLMEHNWDLTEIISSGNILDYEDEYMVITIHENKLKFLKKFKNRSEAEKNAPQIINEFIKNPYGAKYGLYIYKWNNHFEVNKLVNGASRIFGYYKTLDNATFARDLLMEYDWKINEVSDDGPVFYSPVHEKYVVVEVSKDKLLVISFYDSEEEALDDAEKAIEKYHKSKYKTGEKHIVYNGNSYAIHRTDSTNKIVYYGSFREKIDAITVRDILLDVDWDLTLIHENRIYELHDYFWKVHVFEGTIKVIGKYENIEDAFNDSNNLSHITFDDLYNPENQYSKINRYIWKRDDVFWIRKKINGKVQFFGPYDSRNEAIKARDKLEDDNWNIGMDSESLFSQDSEVVESPDVSNLTMWQKIIYDAIVLVDNVEFGFDEIVNHSKLKPYKSGKNFESKVNRYLNELVDLGLVIDLGDGRYFREF